MYILPELCCTTIPHPMSFDMLKWIVLAVLLLIVGTLAIMSFLTRETVIRSESHPDLQPCPDTPNCVSSLSPAGKSRIDAFAISNENPAQSWQRLIQAIEQTGGKVVRHDDRYLHAVYTSTVFRFKDDLEAVLGDGRIDIRSASRAGRSDFGKNRQRVELLREVYDG